MAGFGTYRLSGEEAYKFVTAAITAGIAHIDTAQLYKNESDAYTAFIEARLINAELRLTTKIHRKLIAAADRDNRAIENSVAIKPNLVLLHSPERNFEIAWEQLRRLESSGVSVGVSNFDITHLVRLSSAPAVNQIEVTPFNRCSRTVEYCKKNGIVIEAHSSLCKGYTLADSAVVQLAEQYSMTPAQLLIQWSLNQGYVPIFTSRNPDHIKEVAVLRKNDLVIEFPSYFNTSFKTHPQYHVS